MKDTAEHSAKRIAQGILDATGDALSTGDFAQFAKNFHLPHIMTTQERKITVTDLAHLQRMFDAMRTKLAAGQVTELIRFIEAASFRSSTQIASTHVTHMVRANGQIDEPYPVFSILEKIDGVWKGVSSDYAVPQFSAQENAILGSHGVKMQTE